MKTPDAILENIIELLGSIDGFKTIDILEEMIKASTGYRKHLINCRDIFKTDKIVIAGFLAYPF